jgi:hypothetical protein
MIFALAGEAGAPTGAGPVEASRDSLPFCRALERFPGSLRARNSAQSWRQCPRDSPDCHPTEGHRRTRACRFRPTPRHNLPARCQPKDPARIHGQSGLVSTCRSGSGLHRELWAREAWCFGSYGSVGSWLPEPVIPEDTPNPRENVQQAESLSIAFLVILETLSPTERAVYSLKEVFGYKFGEVACMVQKSEPNCRQLLRRVRRRIDERRPRFESSPPWRGFTRRSPASAP